jgi:hypothetical protein
LTPGDPDTTPLPCRRKEAAGGINETVPSLGWLFSMLFLAPAVFREVCVPLCRGLLFSMLFLAPAVL